MCCSSAVHDHAASAFTNKLSPGIKALSVIAYRPAKMALFLLTTR
jgi:hypothetical protein